MKVDHLENPSLPAGLLAQDSLSGIAELVKEIFTRTRVDGAGKDKLSYWQFIFLQEQLRHHLQAVEFPAHQARN